MTTNNWLLALGGAGLLLYGIRQYKLYQGLQFGIAGLDFNWSLKDPRIDLKLSLNNPTAVSATLQGLTGTVSAGSQYIARVVYNTSQLIAPYNKTFINLSILPDVDGVVQALANRLTNKQTSAVQFRGSAMVDGLPVPVMLDYNL
jgi:LEA14-like dessication related protein